MVTRGPKWDSDRIISTPPVLLDLLAAHLRRRGLTGADGEAFVFTGREGEPLHYPNWRRRVWAPARERADLPDLTFRALRTANTTAMVALAVDIKTAQTRAGHRDARTTLGIYARPTKDADRDAADRLGSYFLGPTSTDHHPSRGMARDRNDTTRDSRGISRDGTGDESSDRENDAPKRALDQDGSRGARWNRTTDLSIISAAL